jgi:hypothetical protein
VPVRSSTIKIKEYVCLAIRAVCVASQDMYALNAILMSIGLLTPTVVFVCRVTR